MSAADTVISSPVLALEGLAENFGGRLCGSSWEDELQPANAAAETMALKPIVKNDRPH